MCTTSRATFSFIMAKLPAIQAAKPARRRRIALALVTLVALFLAQLSPVLAQSSVRPPGNAAVFPDAPEPGPPNTLGERSVSDFWRDYRGGAPRDLQVILGPKPPGTQMTTTGQQWRVLRERVLRKYLGWAPVAVIGLLALVYLLRGPMPIAGGRSGRMLPRFDLTQRIAHWFMASVFLFLAATGLVILLGRVVIAPYLGLKVNSVLATASLQGHNLFGPIFILALVWLFIKFVRGNFFQWIDFKWILKLGGFFGGHVSSSRYNFGEKSWFWLVVLAGLVMAATGIALEFPWLFGDLRILQAATILHVLGAITLISVAIGHIYMGTIGMEGALEGMVTGEVDENWAREHHDEWFKQMRGQGDGEASDAAGTTAGTESEEKK